MNAFFWMMTMGWEMNAFFGRWLLGRPSCLRQNHDFYWSHARL